MKKNIALTFAIFLSVCIFSSCEDSKDSNVNNPSSKVMTVTTEEKATTVIDTTVTEVITTTQTETTTSIPETISHTADKIIINGKNKGKTLIPGVYLGMTNDEFFDKVDTEYNKYICGYDYYVENGLTFADNDEERLHELQSKEYTYVLDSTALFDLQDYSSFFYVSFDYKGILEEYGFNIGAKLDNDGNGTFYLTDDEMKTLYNKIKNELNEIYGNGKDKQEYINDYGFNIGCLEWKGTAIGDIILGAGTELWGNAGNKGIHIYIEGNPSTNSSLNNEEVDEYTSQKVWEHFLQLKIYAPLYKETYEKMIPTVFHDYTYRVSKNNDPNEYTVSIDGNFYMSPEMYSFDQYSYGKVSFIINTDNHSCNVSDDPNHIFGSIFAFLERG